MRPSVRLAALTTALLAVPAMGFADVHDDLHAALHGGKATLELRLRAEYVDTEIKPETDAETLRTVLGYRSGDFHGASAYLEFENVSSLGNGDYNSGTTGAGNNNTAFATIADPALTQRNQSYLEAYGVRAGRQKIVYDNARFIGDVGWRQNDQTYDGVSFANSTWVKDLALNAAWLRRVNNIYAVTRAVDAPLLNVRYTAFPQASVGAFYYAVEEKTAPATSWQHAGARVDGTLGNFLYELSWVDQAGHADATAAGTADATYTDLQLGWKFGAVTVKAQQEVLEPGFKTPLATLHAFNGWADVFLATPANGLEDTNLKLLATAGGFKLALAAHDFQAESTGDDYGQEVDFSISRDLRPGMNLLFKVAEFNADGTVIPNDTRKAWLQLTCKL